MRLCMKHILWSMLVDRVSNQFFQISKQHDIIIQMTLYCKYLGWYCPFKVKKNTYSGEQGDWPPFT